MGKDILITEKNLCIQYTIRYRPNPMSETRRKMHDCINIFFRFFPLEGIRLQFHDFIF